MRNFTCATDRRLLVYWTRAYCQDADAQEKEEKDAGGAQRMELGIFSEDRATAERSSSGVVERRRVVTVPLCTVCTSSKMVYRRYAAMPASYRLYCRCTA